MIVFLKSDGTVAFHDNENINMGSNNANHITLVAPFPASSVVTVAFRLPNGKTLGPQLVTDIASDFNMTSIGEIPGYVVEGATLNAWNYKINSTLTGIMGALTVQMFITSNDGTTLATVSVNVNINSGAPNVALPATPNDDIYGQIISYLSTRYTASELVDLAQAWAQGSSEDLSNAGAPEGSKSSKGWADASQQSADASQQSADTSQQWAESDTFTNPDNNEQTTIAEYIARLINDYPELAGDTALDWYQNIMDGSSKFFALDAYISSVLSEKSKESAEYWANYAESLSLKLYQHELEIHSNTEKAVKKFFATLVIYNTSPDAITSLTLSMREKMRVTQLYVDDQQRLPLQRINYNRTYNIYYVSAIDIDGNGKLTISTNTASFGSSTFVISDKVTEV